MNEGADKFGSLVGCFVLAEDWTILRLNETVVRWLGVDSEDLAGRPFHQVLGPGGQFFLQSQVLPMLRLKGQLEEVYLRMREKSGQTVPVLVNVIRTIRGGVTEIEISFMRIRQRGQLEDELLQAKKLAEQASDSKTKFLGMMSHELRTPLQAISLVNQMLLDGECGALSPDQSQMIESSKASADSVAVLIDDLLEFARMQGGAVQVSLDDLTIAQVFDRAENSTRHRLQQAGLKFTRESTNELLKVRADPNRLQQVLLNLINNALKFTPRNGSVTLTGRRAGELVVLGVTDSGCGIPPEQLQRVFEPFVQLSSSIESSDKPGIGLGLSICRDLVKAMNGSITVASNVGVGTTFSVSLPLA